MRGQPSWDGGATWADAKATPEKSLGRIHDGRQISMPLNWLQRASGGVSGQPEAGDRAPLRTRILNLTLGFLPPFEPVARLVAQIALS